MEGLVRASASFEGRLPELFSGHTAAGQAHPSPYPAACRPQAWSAAASVLALQSVLGLEADVPGGRLAVGAEVAPRLRPLKVTGFALAGQPLEVAVDGQGRVQATTAPGIEVVPRGAA